MSHIRQIILSDDILTTIKNYGLKHFPHECCGMLTGDIRNKEGIKFSYPKTWYPIDNKSNEDNKWDYVMDPNQYMNILQKTNIMYKKSNIHLSALFHTHPHNNPIPSQYDVIGAAWKTVYLIYGVLSDDLAAWYWTGKEFHKIQINNEGMQTFVIKKDNIERNWETWNNVGSVS